VNLADGISPSEAVALALERSPQLPALRKGRAAAEGAVGAAKVLSNPELRTGKVDFIDDAGAVRSQTYNLALRWTPPRFGERSLKGEVALGRVSEVGAEISAAEQKLAAEVRLLHMNILFLDEQIKVADASVKLRERMVEFLRAQVDAGVKTAFDQNLAELALADARVLPAAWRSQRRMAMTRLAAELGQAQSNDLALQPEGQPLVLQFRPLETASLIEGARSRRSELAVLSARCAQADTSLRLRKNVQYPWFSFLQLSRDFGGPSRSNAWGVRFGVDLPIFKWGKATVEGPTAEAEQCRLEIAATGSRIAVEIEQLAEQLRSSATDLEYHQQTIAPLVERAVALSESAVAAGQADLLQSLTAEARRLGQQQTYLSKLLDYRRLEIDLDLALGRAILP
jgi:outer membrane protein TolC